jgi:hypothetical protein
MKLINLLNKIIVLGLLLTSGLLMFGAGGSQLSVNRDFDAAIGLIERPLNTASKLTKFLKPLAASAQGTAQEPTQLLILAESKIESAINRAIRAAVLAFVKGLLDFLQDKFNELLSLVEDWAQSLLGIRLNLSHIRRFVALQAYTYYNQVEGQINNYFDRVLGPLEKIDPAAKKQLSEALSEASEAYVLANGVDEACQGVQGQCNNQQPSNLSSMNSRLDGAISNVAATNTRAQQQNERDGVCDVRGGNNPLLAGLCVSAPLEPAQARETAAIAEMTTAVQQRVEDVRAGVQKAVKQENINNNSNSCGTIIRKINGGVAGASAGISRDSRLQKEATEGKFNNRITREAFLATRGYAPDGLDEGECEMANKAAANKEALAQVNQAKNQAAGEESLANAVLSVIQDFFSDIFDKLQDIIKSIIDDVLNGITEAIAKIGNQIVSSALGTAFDGFADEFRGIASDTFNKARDGLETDLNAAAAREIN